MNKLVLLWCSPGFGLVDVWLPVVKKLKEKDDVYIYFVFPQPSTLLLEEKTSDLFNLSEKFSDKVLFRGYSDRWFISDTLAEAASGICHSNIDEKILRLSIRLNKGKLSRVFLFKLLSNFLLSIFKYISSIKENFRNTTPYDIKALNNVSCILYDVTVEDKHVNHNLNNEFLNVPKFSMLHGLDAVWLDKSFLCKKPVDKRSDLIVYSSSTLESCGYKKCFGVLDENLMCSGFVRHDSEWIEFICNFSEKNELDESFNQFVFIIGAPASPYNPPERKKKMLKNIFDLICVKYNLKLVIKTHPKENLDGIDGQIYKDAFGDSNYGKKWVYSDKSPFILGKKAIFACSFGSGVALDMLAINKPTIDCLNLNGLKLYDTNNSLRDEFKNPVFPISYLKLVLVATSHTDLEQHVKSIMNEYENTVRALRSRYNEFFKLSNNSPAIVAKNIYKRIS